MTDRFNDKTVTQPVQLTEAEVALRKRWLEFSPADETIIQQDIDPLVSGSFDALIEQMYDHFLSFEETRSFFPDESILKRAQTAQKRYFERLTKGNYGLDYVNDRLGVGSTHHRIDLDPKWYIGAYNRVLSWYLPKLIDRFSTDPGKLQDALLALIKLVFLDMGLAIECYILAKEQAIRKHRDALRELETERRTTKSILESAPIGIVTLSEELVCIECNEIFSEMVGKDRELIIGCLLFEVAPQLKNKVFFDVLRTKHAYQETAKPIRFSTASTADETYWDWAVWPVKDDAGNATSLVAMFANATDRVILQQQREDFVATLTHDLKTPVSATNRAVRFLLDGDFGAVSEGQKEILDTILQSNTALYSLVQTLLDVYKFDSGVKELHIKRCNLAVVMTQMVTEIMPLAQEKGVELKITLPIEPPEVMCDEDEIRRVLQNLIDNSLKFTPNGGSVEVTVKYNGEKTLVSVADTGKGIPEENKPKLFQRFWQAGSTGRYYASTGLGLYLSRRIIEGHSGRIWCESTYGQGSTFFFELNSLHR
ncbi:MAG TPA: protoglobin domain-containing protein [Oculatellaceae cyanobacterium]